MAVQINKTSKTPFVHLCSEKGTFILEGVILPEDTFAFFKPINSYVDDYLKEPKESTTLILKLDYFNTAASRMLYNFLKSFNDAYIKTKTTVEFHYEDDDDDLGEVCDEFIDMLAHLNFKKLPFDLLHAPTFEKPV